MRTIHFFESSKRATPRDNFAFKILETKNISDKKIKIDEPMNSTNGSPKFVALKILKILTFFKYSTIIAQKNKKPCDLIGGKATIDDIVKNN